MNGFNKFLTATFLSVAVFFSGAAQAMEIRQFDKMVDQDQAEFVSALIQGAEKVLTDEGRPDMAAKVSHLFTTNLLGANISIGMAEFMRNLARARLADVKRIENDLNARRLEVEDAMIVTMRKNGIELPPSFLTVASNFKPKFPPPTDVQTPLPSQ